MNMVKRFNARYLWLAIVAVFAGMLWLMLEDRGEEIPKLPRNEIESTLITGDRLNVTLIAKEPDVINPMTMCVDRSGAIYVSESFTYRYGLEGSPAKDSLTLNPIKRIELDPHGKPVKVTIVAQGFANPVMGIDIYRNKLYATCLNELFAMDIGADGQLSNKTVLVKDSAKPWNPFGMYRVAVGPDAKLWLAIADHPDSKPVTLTGSDGSRLQLRGQSGGFVRCNIDGSALELVVQGFRAPFAFDFDPWGHLWAISNGERSPNIYVDVIPGMDYGYHSRNVSYGWLAGKTSLAPPVTEMGSGANTVAVHYYGSMFPPDYWGSILVANWGSHGAFPTNRIIKQFVQQQKPVPDSVKLIGEAYRETAAMFLSSTDSLFRPVGMALAPDGGLYLADWHGHDDESDTTGRIFKLTYIGRTSQRNKYDPGKISKSGVKQLCDLLGNHNKFIRLDAQEALVQLGAKAILPLERLLKKGNAFEAANAIWTLMQLRDSAAVSAMFAALQHKDARVRAMALRQLRQAAGQPIGRSLPFAVTDSNSGWHARPLLNPEKLAALAAPMFLDPDPEVRIEAALSQYTTADITRGLMAALSIAGSKRSRYQIGFELGRYGDSATLLRLYDTTDPAKYRVALIAAQTAVNEKTPLAKAVSGWDLSKDENMAKDLVAQIEAGKVQPREAAERLMALEWLEEYPRVPNSSLTAFLTDCLRDDDYLVKETTLQVLRQRLLQVKEIEEAVRSIMRQPKDSLYPFMPVEAMYTVGSFTDPGPVADWLEKIRDTSGKKVIEILRALREQPRDTVFINNLWPYALEVSQRNSALSEECWVTFKKIGLEAGRLSKLSQPPARPANKAELMKKIMSGLPGASARRGKWTFNSSCVSCHSTKADEGVFRLGPNLSDIGSSSQPEYLIESVLEPNKVLKTGYQMETIETKDGKLYYGQVETLGENILIRRIGESTVTLSMEQIKKRNTSHISPMPDGLYDGMTIKELADLTAYLISLKGGN
ncbi:MAG: c-type cytochrome [Chitinophagaceae bacterium]|nr:c-type cytochrome [Chitinophagaceae bacterium]